MTKNEVRLPCGCWRGIRVRQAPAFDERPHAVDATGKILRDARGGPLPNPNYGHAILEGGAFKMVEVEELEDAFCQAHSADLRERQIAVQRMVEESMAQHGALTEEMGRRAQDVLLAREDRLALPDATADDHALSAQAPETD